MALFLRTCNSNFTSYINFQYPNEVGAIVSAPDWDPKPECGNGLHGLLNGNGDSSLLSREESAIWMVVEANIEECIDLNGKYKFPKCSIKYIGKREDTVKYLVQQGCTGVHFSTNTGGDGSTNTGGDGSKNTGGDESKNIGRDSSKNTGGDSSKNTGGDSSKNTGGYRSKNTGGNYSTNTGGHCSTNTGGNDSTNIGRDRSTNTGGYGSTNTGGYGSTNTGGNGSTVCGGENSKLILSYYDGRRSRSVVGYVGEDGIEANVKYKLGNEYKFVKVE